MMLGKEFIFRFFFLNSFIMLVFCLFLFFFFVEDLKLLLLFEELLSLGFEFDDIWLLIICFCDFENLVNGWLIWGCFIIKFFG